MKKPFPILLAIWPYLFFVIAFAVHDNHYDTFFYGYILLTIFVYIANIFYVCRYQGEKAYFYLAYWDRLIKLIHIPFYLIVAGLNVFLLLVMVVPAFIMMSPIMITVLIWVDFFLMVTSSMYGIIALFRANQMQVVNKKFALVHMILHFIFILDVVSAALVFKKLKQQENQHPQKGL